MDFKTACKQMGGEYEYEEGLLEPDVGYETMNEKLAIREWCTFRLDGGWKLSVFNAPNTFSLRLGDRNMNELFEFWDNDVKKEFNENGLCFITPGVRFPEGKVCVKKYGKHLQLEVTPTE